MNTTQLPLLLQVRGIVTHKQKHPNKWYKLGVFVIFCHYQVTVLIFFSVVIFLILNISMLSMKFLLITASIIQIVYILYKRTKGMRDIDP